VISKTALKRCLLPISALSLTIFSSGCGTTPAETPVKRELPEPPAFAQPVEVRDLRKSDSCWVRHDAQRDGRILANSIIERYNGWYREVMQSYARPKR
jgi:hypothetical protein